MATQRNKKVARECGEEGRGGRVVENGEWRVESEKVCSI